MTEGFKGAAKRPIIAVVDDDPAVCGSLKFALELEGFAVRTYHSGAELIRADALEGFDCFVVDQRMPGMTGMELVEVLRARRVLTPAILIISHPNAAHIYEIGESRGSHFLAMEYIEGETLEARLTGEPMAVAQILAIGAQVGMGSIVVAWLLSSFGLPVPVAIVRSIPMPC